MTPIRREAVGGLRQSLKLVGMVVAEVDRQLRYRWIENPHPDFDATLAVGKRDNELIAAEEAADIMSLKRAVFASAAPVSRTLPFKRSDGLRHYTIFGYPIIEPGGDTEALLTIAVPVPQKR